MGTFCFALRGSGLCGGQEAPSSYDDIWVYLSWVRDFADSERLALVDPYFGERIAEFSRAKVNGWLLEQAALSRVSGLDTIELVLRYLTPTLVVVALLMVYALALAILKSERAAVLIAYCLRPVPHHLYPAFRAQRRGGAGSPHLGGDDEQSSWFCPLRCSSPCSSWSAGGGGISASSRSSAGLR